MHLIYLIYFVVYKKRIGGEPSWNSTWECHVLHRQNSREIWDEMYCLIVLFSTVFTLNTSQYKSEGKYNTISCNAKLIFEKYNIIALCMTIVSVFNWCILSLYYYLYVFLNVCIITYISYTLIHCFPKPNTHLFLMLKITCSGKSFHPYCPVAKGNQNVMQKRPSKEIGDLHFRYHKTHFHTHIQTQQRQNKTRQNHLF